MHSWQLSKNIALKSGGEGLNTIVVVNATGRTSATKAHVSDGNGGPPLSTICTAQGSCAALHAVADSTKTNTLAFNSAKATT